jgi:outer membrane protein assembly factor BamB
VAATRPAEHARKPATLKALSLALGVACFVAYGLHVWAVSAAQALPASAAAGWLSELGLPGAPWATFAANFRRNGVAAGVHFPLGPLRQRWRVRATERVWNYQTRAGVWSSSAAIARVGRRVVIFAGHYDRNLYAFDAKDGRRRWKFPTGGVPTEAPTVALLDGRPAVLFTSTDRCLYAVRADTGKPLWVFETYPWKDTVQPAVGSSPVVVDCDGRTRIIFTIWNSDKDPSQPLQRGELIALDVSSPDRAVWRVELGTTPLSSPALASDPEGTVLIVASLDGKLRGMDAVSGATLWEFTAGAQFGGTPSVGRCGAELAAFVGDRFGSVHAIATRSGSLLWTRRVGHMVDATPVVVNRSGWSHETSRFLWTHATRGETRFSSPAAGRDAGGLPIVVLPAYDGCLYCFSPSAAGGASCLPDGRGRN